MATQIDRKPNAAASGKNLRKAEGGGTPFDQSRKTPVDCIFPERK
jgi:hypothetical protein